MRTHERGDGGRVDHMAPVLLTEREKLCITRVMMLGCTFRYYDYGHPERIGARKYWQSVGPGPRNRVGFGYDEKDAAYDFLRRYNPELL